MDNFIIDDGLDQEEEEVQWVYSMHLVIMLAHDRSSKGASHRITSYHMTAHHITPHHVRCRV